MSAFTPTEPLPWTKHVIGQSDDSADVCVVRGATGHAVAEYLAEQDADLIVQCANSHDALLTACQKALGILSGEDMNKQALIDALTLCRAALSLAGQQGQKT